MSAATSNLTIFFADIGGSTALYQSVGDVEATRLVADALERMTRLVTGHGGEVLRTVGDEVLATFSGPDEAVTCAVDMGQFFAGHELGVRIGFHHGEAIPHQGDVYGNAVNLAARISSMAKVGEIVTSGETVERFSDNALAVSGSSVEQLATVTFKGMENPTDVYRVQWQRTIMTSMTTRTALMGSNKGVLEPVLHLDYVGQNYVLPEGKFSIGRSPGCDIQVDVATASRNHATIELKNDKYWFTDESSNGSWYCRSGEGPMRLLRETAILSGTGSLGIGFLPDAGQLEDAAEPGVVRFRIVAEFVER